VRFPFSDLSASKLRPAVALADTGQGDWLLYQVTSKPYGHSTAVLLAPTAFIRGSLRIASYARPAKLFTASPAIIAGEIGLLRLEVLADIIEVLITLLRTAVDRH